MAMRGGATRRMIGNPMGGILRDIDRRTRSTSRRRPRPAPDPQREELAPPAGPPVLSAILTAGQDGRAVWDFSAVGYGQAPVLTALPVVEPGSVPWIVVVERATPGQAVFRLAPLLDGAQLPEGLAVHVTATPARG